MKQIAAACRVSDPTVYGWLRSSQPRNKHLAMLATFLDTTVDFLVNGEQSETRDEIIQELRTLVPKLSTKQLEILLQTAKEFSKKTA
ncbi:hypothetical protein PWG14_25215 [Chromobacterium amazonense]|uniref:hypothetical protein n=1 Tax=Chromobacterium amazonense TaxID=1382803 RepID=UPI00237E6FD0|nr:hypothetical protein [Chromobacterium amazonense]MDE1715771.1 hypothetical protein [Chromobacterium amazonense]